MTKPVRDAHRHIGRLPAYPFYGGPAIRADVTAKGTIAELITDLDADGIERALDLPHDRLPAPAHRRVAVARDGVETREERVQRVLVRAHRGVLEHVRGLADVPALRPCIHDRIGVGVGVGVGVRARAGKGREVERLRELLEGTHEPTEGVLDRVAR